MGNSTYDPGDWAAYSRSTASKTRAEIFKSYGLADELNPKNIKFRESRDSTANPKSTPIIVGVDVTGSMGVLAETIAKRSLGPMFLEIYNRKPVSDPHIMFMGIGDAVYDQAPLQVSQFEAGHKEISSQLEKLYLEGGGGGNNGESYNLAWYFAARKTRHDAFEKRKQKGILFTLGDEPLLDSLTKSQIKKFIGDDVQSTISSSELLDMVSKTYDVFHLMVMQGSYARSRPDDVKTSWRNALGERAIPLTDIDKMAEVIVSILEVHGGKDKDSVVSSWSGTTAVVVQEAIKDMVATSTSKDNGVIRL